MLTHLPQAIEFEQEAVRLNPSVSDRWNKLSELYASAGQVELAQQAREKAQELAQGAGSR
jgi:tetratricopeptide (TPR) repeat protein